MSRVAVAAASQIAADAGIAAASKGGNAVDAAIAAAITSMCTDPGVIALGGGGFIAVCHPNHDRVVIDCNPEMPGRSAAPERFGSGVSEVFMDYGGGMTTGVGHGSVATPGAMKGLGVAHQMFGEAPWAQVVRPTMHWAEHGFTLSGAAAEYLTYAHDVIFGWHPESRQALHHPDGSYLKEGEIVQIPGLSESLAVIAAEGPEVLYTGELAQRMVEGNLENGGLLGLDDLAAYEAVPRSPIPLQVGGWSLGTNPAPAIGGATAAAIVLLLSDMTEWSPESVRDVVRAQDAVFAFRRQRLDEAIDTLPEIESLLEQAETRQLLASGSTIHVSAVDEGGIACSITMSAGYGSGTTIPGSGIWLNNSLGEVELQTLGLHALDPGTRLVSNMAPTVGRGPDGSVLAVGTPGASRITSALALTILNLLRLGMPLEEAVEHPRLHVETFDGKPTVAYEPGIEVPELAGFTHRAFTEKSMYFGGVQAAMWTPAGGLTATGDSRRNGRVAIGG